MNDFKFQRIKNEIERLKHNTPSAYDRSQFMLLEEISDFIKKVENEVEPKFKVGDKLISTKNPKLTYEVLSVGNVNELGNLEYEVEIFCEGKPGLHVGYNANLKHDAYLEHNINRMECKKVDEWAALLEGPENEETVTIDKKFFEYYKKSWYDEGYIDGKYDRPNQFDESVSDLEKAAEQWEISANTSPFYMALDDKGNPYDVKQDIMKHGDSFKAGAKWQEGQMLKKAQDATVWKGSDGNLYAVPITVKLDGEVPDKKKVKLIVIDNE